MGKKLICLLCLVLGVIALTSTAALGLSYDLKIANGGDDVEEYASGHGMYVDSSDLEIPYEDAGNPPSTEQIIGLRWTVDIPKGAQILKAYVELNCDETKGGTDPVNVIVEGQLAPNAPAFTAATADVTSRPPTKAQVKWAFVNWTAGGQKAQSPDLSPILQEIIDQPGWVAGNALVLIIRDDKSNPSKGVRCADAVEDGNPPVLHIEVFNPSAYAPTPADGMIGVFMPLLNWTKGDGAIFHNVYLGKTPDLTEADLVSGNSPVPMYYHVAGLDAGSTYYWRVDEVDAAGKVTAGPVWSFVMQGVTAYYPAPTDGSVDVSPTGTLTWQAGLAAMKHHLYLGASRDDVVNGAAGADKGELALDKATYTLTGLDSVTTYYWRVDELGLGGEVKTGPVWSFTTYLPVDDFESYTDDEGSRIYETWIDGWTNNTGSTVGNTTAPFAEQTIIRQGKQSMPMDYNNVNTPFYSEAEQEFSPLANWTVGEVTDLRLEFRGNVRNDEGPLYVAVEDSSGKSAVVTHSSPAAIVSATWAQWKIPLSSFTGVNLAKVKKLYVGVGDRQNPAAGGAGRIYIDDIRVTKP
jgi:hypothetical protein